MIGLESMISHLGINWSRGYLVCRCDPGHKYILRTINFAAPLLLQ